MKRKQRSPAQIWTRKATVAILLIAIPIMLTELILRLFGYSRPQVPAQLQTVALQQCAKYLNDRFKTNAFTIDSYLLWKLNPGSNIAGLDVSEEGLLGAGNDKKSGPRKS